MNKASEPYRPRHYIAGFDLNSDRVNIVIVDEEGLFLDVRARDLRMKALARLMDYAHYHGATDYVFKELSRPGTKTASKTANRKITKFPLREHLQHAQILVP